MFTCAICEPSENCNGKRGIIIHAHEEAAKRNSINRPRGTIELVPDNVDGEEFYKGQTKEGGIIDQICKSSSPDELPLIQLDNAAPHTGNHMKERLEDFIKKTVKKYKIMFTNHPIHLI